MRTYLTVSAIAALVALGFQPVAWGQGRSTGRSTQTFSPSTFGGSTGTGGVGVGTGGARSSQQGVGVGALSTSGAVEVNLPQTGGFVGADIEDVRGAMEVTGAQRGMGTPQQGGFGQRGVTSRSPGFRTNLSGRGGQFSGFGSRSGRASSQIRTSLRVGFSFPRPNAPRASEDLGSKLAARVQNSSWIQNRAPVSVVVQNGIATLKGEVATEYDRLVAERLARLEPGIGRVDNQLTLAKAVESPAGAAATP